MSRLPICLPRCPLLTRTLSTCALSMPARDRPGMNVSWSMPTTSVPSVAIRMELPACACTALNAAAYWGRNCRPSRVFPRTSSPSMSASAGRSDSVAVRKVRSGSSVRSISDILCIIMGYPGFAGQPACQPLQGAMAEWLCSGLQIRVRRFDSGLRLQYLAAVPHARTFPPFKPGNRVPLRQAATQPLHGCGPARLPIGGAFHLFARDFGNVLLVPCLESQFRTVESAVADRHGCAALAQGAFHKLEFLCQCQFTI